MNVNHGQHVPVVGLEGKVDFVCLWFLPSAHGLDHKGAADQVGRVTQFRMTCPKPDFMDQIY